MTKTTGEMIKEALEEGEDRAVCETTRGDSAGSLRDTLLRTDRRDFETFALSWASVSLCLNQGVSWVGGGGARL